MNITLSNGELAVLFAIFFVLVGYIAPMAFAAYVPADHYIEVNDFQAESVEYGADSHTICLDRDVNDAQSGTIISELYLVNGDGGERVEIDSTSAREYFDKGDFTVQKEMNLPPSVQPGEYRYVMVIQISPAQGRVTRTIEFTSNDFTILEPGESVNRSKQPVC